MAVRIRIHPRSTSRTTKGTKMVLMVLFTTIAVVSLGILIFAGAVGVWK
jgi:cell division protein FtsL